MTPAETPQTSPTIRKRPNGRGMENGHSKLTDDQVLAIRRERQAGETMAVLAHRYSTTAGNIHAIVHRRTWTHLSEENRQPLEAVSQTEAQA